MKKDFDQVSVASLEIVPIESPKSSQMIVHGPGLSRPMVLSFDEAKTFEASARLMAACSMINREQFVVVVGHLAERFLKPPEASRTPAQDAADGSGSVKAAKAGSKIDDLGEIDWLIEHAVSFRARCVSLGLTSDALIASLLSISMGDSAMISLAEGAISRGISPYAQLAGSGSPIGSDPDRRSSPPWVVRGEDGEIVVNIGDSDAAFGGIVVLGIPDREEIRMSAGESSLVGAALQSASAFIQRSRLSSVVSSDAVGDDDPGSVE